MKIQTKSKSILFIIFLLITVLLLPMASVSAATTPVYVALGDSTGYGLSAFPDPGIRDNSTLDGYNDQFAAFLTGIYGGVDYTNLARPGDKTSDLLAKLQTAQFRNLVRKAKAVTVSIGGNNLLGPALAAIFGLWEINPDDYDDPDGSDLLDDLAEAIAYKFATIPGYSPMDDFEKLLDPTDQAALDFQSSLLQGIADFQKEWPAIAARIQNLNRTCEFYVNTVHNPLSVSDSSDPLYPLYLEFEALIGTINLTIKAYALVYGYRVVDAYQAVKTTPDARTFDIRGAIEAASMMIAVGPTDPLYPAYYLAFLQMTDPHPTYCGHVAIFEALKNVRANTPSWYWWLR